MHTCIPISICFTGKSESRKPGSHVGSGRSNEHCCSFNWCRSHCGHSDYTLERQPFLYFLAPLPTASSCISFPQGFIWPFSIHAEPTLPSSGRLEVPLRSALNQWEWEGISRSLSLEWDSPKVPVLSCRSESPAGLNCICLPWKLACYHNPCFAFPFSLPSPYRGASWDYLPNKLFAF